MAKMHSSIHTILIIEHDNATRELYTRELGREFVVIACSDVQNLSVLLDTQQIDAIVLEPNIAGGQGWQVFDQLKQNAQTQAIPVIVCSTLDERRRAMQLGGVGYLLKPVLPSTLLESIRKLNS